MVYYYNNYDSENSLRFDLRNTTNDLSYTFGEDYNLSLGLGSISNGKGKIVTNSREYETSNVNGNHYFSILGIELGYFELLFGYRRLQFEYKDFKRESLGKIVILDTIYKISGGYKIFGIGFSF